MDLAEDVYRATKIFPKDELYTLTSQLRRAAISIPSNIAEGKGRSSERELVQFLHYSKGSLFEIETQLAIARRLGYLDVTQTQNLLRKTVRVGQLLNGFIRAFRRPAAG
jgi:four helix bundle protein